MNGSPMCDIIYIYLYNVLLIYALFIFIYSYNNTFFTRRYFVILVRYDNKINK